MPDAKRLRISSAEEPAALLPSPPSALDEDYADDSPSPHVSPTQPVRPENNNNNNPTLASEAPAAPDRCGIMMSTTVFFKGQEFEAKIRELDASLLRGDSKAPCVETGEERQTTEQRVSGAVFERRSRDSPEEETSSPGEGARLAEGGNSAKESDREGPADSTRDSRERALQAREEEAVASSLRAEEGERKSPEGAAAVPSSRLLPLSDASDEGGSCPDTAAPAPQATLSSPRECLSAGSLGDEPAEQPLPCCASKGSDCSARKRPSQERLPSTRATQLEEDAAAERAGQAAFSSQSLDVIDLSLMEDEAEDAANVQNIAPAEVVDVESDDAGEAPSAADDPDGTLFFDEASSPSPLHTHANSRNESEDAAEATETNGAVGGAGSPALRSREEVVIFSEEEESEGEDDVRFVSVAPPPLAPFARTPNLQLFSHQPQQQLFSHQPQQQLFSHQPQQQSSFAPLAGSSSSRLWNSETARMAALPHHPQHQPPYQLQSLLSSREAEPPEEESTANLPRCPICLKMYRHQGPKGGGSAESGCVASTGNPNSNAGASTGDGGGEEGGSASSRRKGGNPSSSAETPASSSLSSRESSVATSRATSAAAASASVSAAPPSSSAGSSPRGGDDVDNIVALKCGHVFCQGCLVEALRANKRCPVCRTNLPGRRPYQRIFL